MSFFSQLPASVLQAGAIFLSIIIEALPFVLIGSIISGFIEVYVTPDKVYRFLPMNKWARIFFGSLVFGKESSQLHGCAFSGNGSSHQPHRALCDLLSLW